MAQVLPVALAAAPHAGQLLLRALRLRVQLCDLRTRQAQLVRWRRARGGGDGRIAPAIRRIVRRVVRLGARAAPGVWGPAAPTHFAARSCAPAAKGPPPACRLV